MIYHWEAGGTSGMATSKEEIADAVSRYNDGVSPIIVRKASHPEIVQYSMFLEYMGIVNSWEEFQEMYSEN